MCVPSVSSPRSQNIFTFRTISESVVPISGSQHRTVLLSAPCVSSTCSRSCSTNSFLTSDHCVCELVSLWTNYSSIQSLFFFVLSVLRVSFCLFSRLHTQKMMFTDLHSLQIHETVVSDSWTPLSLNSTLSSKCSSSFFCCVYEIQRKCSWVSLSLWRFIWWMNHRAGQLSTFRNIKRYYITQ